MTDAPGVPRLGRRAVLVAGGGLLVAGCSSSPREQPSSRGTTTRDLTPDVAVATTALTQVRAARAAVEATVQRFPGLRTALQGVQAMHAAHESALVDAVPERARTTATPAAYAVPARRPAALQRLAQTERQLHDSLGGLALRAQSGDFARLLAAMGAGLGQRLATWPT